MTTSRRSRQTSFVDGCKPVSLLPTPNACNASNDVNLTLSGDGRAKPNKLGWAVAQMLPTPNDRETGRMAQNSLTQDVMIAMSSPTRFWLTPTPAVVVGGRKDPSITAGMADHYLRTNGEGNLMEQVAAHELAPGGFSPLGIPASRSATPGSEPERMTPGTSGRGYNALLPASMRTGPIGSCLKTLLDTSLWGSTVCSLTWRVKATPAGRPLFRLLASVRSTGGTGSGLSDAEPTVTLFQIPMPSDVTGGRTTKGSKRQGETGLRQQAIALQPNQGQRLNPDFVERLMGFPPGWTVLSPASELGGSTGCR